MSVPSQSIPIDALADRELLHLECRKFAADRDAIRIKCLKLTADRDALQLECRKLTADRDALHFECLNLTNNIECREPAADRGLLRLECLKLATTHGSHVNADVIDLAARMFEFVSDDGRGRRIGGRHPFISCLDDRVPLAIHRITELLGDRRPWVT